MASRNTDGSFKTQDSVVISARHTGERIAMGNSEEDTVVSRKEDID